MMKYGKSVGHLKALVLPVVVICSFEVAVCVFVALGGSSPKLVIFPAPSTVLRQASTAIRQQAVLMATGMTLGTTLLGFSLGIVGALLTGSLLGVYRSIEELAAPSLHFLRSLPVVIYVPMALVLLGSDLRVPIVLSALITTLYGAIPVARAIRDYDIERVLFLRARGYTTPRIVGGFILPVIFGALLTSASIAATLALSVTVVAEMLLQGFNGLGALIIRAKEQSAYALLWGLTVILGCCGFAFHSLVLYLWRFAAPWVDDSQRSDAGG